MVVDGYFDAIQAFDDYYEEVSDAMFADHPLDPAQQRHWFDMRRAMVRFHRLVVPHARSRQQPHALSTSPRSSTPTSRTSTTTSCGSASPPIRSATW